MSRRVFAILCFGLLLFSSCASSGTGGSRTTHGPAKPATDPASPTPETLASLQQTEQLLLMTPPQASNPYSLDQRLKTHASSAPARVSRTTPLNGYVGKEDSFWIDNEDTETYSRIRARLVSITAHVYMYVEDGQSFSQAALQASANTFEQQIYPQDRLMSGNEWTPGIDDDVHITILNAAGLGNNVGGYFSAEDEYPTSVYAYSNQREMFYINLDSEIPGSTSYNGALANAFQQLIDWHEHPLTLDWVHQGMAILAQHINNYPASGVDQTFLQAPDTQLNSWSSDPKLEAKHAGAAYLFMDYFAEHYGGYSVLKELLQDPAMPPTNFDHVLAKNGYTDRFTDVLRKWLVANAVANTGVDSEEYGYPTIHIPGVTPQHLVNSYPLNETDQVSQYAAEYYDLHPQSAKPETLTVHLSGTPTVRLLGNTPLNSSYEWWGNRADNMDSTLTRSFDLRSLARQHVTLQFAAWFDLEQDHDYAYAEVSTDGGTNWTTLKGNFTTSTNPAGLNWGNGYTGVSGGGTTPAWVQESIDLTPYAGKKILLRFEEVTDNTSDSQGFAIDQIRIPQLHFQDDLTGDNGWISHGFVRTNNILPEHFLVQAVVYSGSTFTVQAMNVDLASAQGNLTISRFGGQVTRVVLVVAAYALDTTLQAHYQLEISAA